MPPGRIVRYGKLEHPVARRPRVVLYSHDTMGLGHMRRNLLIAHVLARPPLEAVVLLVAGARRATAFPLPRGADCLTLPALRKEGDGTYRSRRLDVSVSELIALRASAIQSSVLSFDPEVLIVDNVPRGAVRELDPVLAKIRRRGKTFCVLGLRDVLDDAAAVSRDWSRAENEDAIRSFYDAIWVYGDPKVYDLAREYSFPSDVAAKLRYTGYFDQKARLDFAEDDGAETFERLGLPPGRLVLCLLGGGQDGANLGEAFARAELPPGTNAVIVTGPFLDKRVQRRLRDLTRKRPRTRVVEFVPEPIQFAARADRIVSMGGYNTTCETLSLGKCTLIVPRVKPRTEQLIRARRLERLGLVDVLHPDDLAPAAISRWLAKGDAAPPAAHGRIDFNGLSRLSTLVEEGLAMPVPREPSLVREGARSVAR